MKRLAFTVGVAMTAAMVSATPADAQMGGHHLRGDSGDQKPAKKPKVDERTYNEALKTIPDSKEKFDPWESLGVSFAEKKPK